MDWRLSFLLPACSSSPPISIRTSGAVDRPLLTALFTFLGTLSLLLLLPSTLQHLHPFPPPPSCQELSVVPVFYTTRLLSVSPRVYSILLLHCFRVLLNLLFHHRRDLPRHKSRAKLDTITLYHLNLLSRALHRTLSIAYFCFFRSDKLTDDVVYGLVGSYLNSVAVVSGRSNAF